MSPLTTRNVAGICSVISPMSETAGGILFIQCATKWRGQCRHQVIFIFANTFQALNVHFCVSVTEHTTVWTENV